jgi:hypothetical protein
MTMGQELIDLSFEEWVKHIFDHPVTDPAWYWDTDRDWWSESESPSTTVSFMTQLFENGGFILAPYSDAQINQAFWYIDSEIHGYMYTLREPRVPLSNRLRCINSIYNLFEQVFAKRCSQHLSHVRRPSEPNPEGLSELNSICYMWWDISPLYGAMEVDNLQLISEAVLNVMKKALELDSVACQESALHGLGHWHLYFPAQVYDIIEAWFKKHPNLSEGLRLYAERAQSGGVL